VNIRDRIKELRRVPADQLQPNPKNWRKHPEAQANALRGVLAEVGIASAVLARETPEGGLMLIDGHLRTETLHNAEIPVLVLDVNEEEADKILATFDPLGAMAESDADALRALLEDVETGSQELADMLTALAEDAGILDGADAAEEEGQYTRTVEAPIYKPTGPKPELSALKDDTKYRELVKAIDASSLPGDEKEFLKAAACRHIVFNYEQIAEYYAHSDDSTKRLMEDSALVIIDWGRAIELGYVQLSKKLAELYGEEYGQDA